MNAHSIRIEHYMYGQNKKINNMFIMIRCQFEFVSIYWQSYASIVN